MLKKTVFGMALCWTALIAVLCLVSFGKFPSVSISGADKYVHFTFHFVFTLLWSFYLKLRHDKIEIKQVIKIAILSFAYGILIEFLQETVTTTRHADIFDVLANTTGAITALLLFIFLRKHIEKQNMNPM